MVVGEGAFGGSCHQDGGAQAFGQLADCGGTVARTSADDDGGAFRHRDQVGGVDQGGVAGGGAADGGAGSGWEGCGGRQHVQRDFDVDGARAGGLEHAEGAGHDFGQFGGVEDGVAEGAERGDGGSLALQLVQPAASHAEVAAVVDAAQHQHRAAVRIGLGDGGGGVGQAWACRQKAGGGAAGYPRVAVGHEGGALLVTRRYVADGAMGQATVKLQRVDAGYAEHGVDAVGFKQTDRRFAACRLAGCWMAAFGFGGHEVTCGSFFESPGGTG